MVSANQDLPFQSLYSTRRLVVRIYICEQSSARSITNDTVDKQKNTESGSYIAGLYLESINWRLDITSLLHGTLALSTFRAASLSRSPPADPNPHAIFNEISHSMLLSSCPGPPQCFSRASCIFRHSLYSFEQPSAPEARLIASYTAKAYSTCSGNTTLSSARRLHITSASSKACPHPAPCCGVEACAASPMRAKFPL